MGDLHLLVGLPLKKPLDKSIAQVTKVVKRFPNHNIKHIEVPNFRIGTLDELMSATDSVQSVYDKTCKLVEKIMTTRGNLKKTGNDKLVDDPEDLLYVLRGFQWSMSQYPINQSIKHIIELIETHVNQTHNELTKLTGEYSEITEELKRRETQQETSLLHRDVSLIVKKEDFVLNSKYLLTVLVVVPKARYIEWLNCYERIDREVVPRSSRLVFEDKENGLFTVTLFRRHLDLFRERALELKFTVKDFFFDEEAIEKDRSGLYSLKDAKTKMYPFLMHWLRSNLNQSYRTLVHVQVLRVAVECLLRYGLPPNFFLVAVSVDGADRKKLISGLRKEYEDIDESLKYISNQSKDDDSEDLPFVHFGMPTEKNLLNIT